jgi:aminoacylase
MTYSARAGAIRSFSHALYRAQRSVHAPAMARLLRVACFALVAAAAVAIPDEDALERFRSYLRIKTDQPRPDYEAAALFLAAQGEEMGLDVRTLRFVEHKPVVLLLWHGSEPELPSIMLNSHTDVVPAETAYWSHPPFGAETDESGRIFARGSQDMKCVGMQYLEAIRRLQRAGYTPRRTLVVSFVPDEEIGGHAGMEGLVESPLFAQLRVGLELDEGWASGAGVDTFPVFWAERCPWWFTVRAEGQPGHGSKLVDGGAMENLAGAIARIFAFRAEQFERVKRGEAVPGAVTSVNMVYLRGGVPSQPGAPFADASFHMNMQPSSAEAGFDMRVPPMTGAEMDALEARMHSEWAPASLNLSIVWVQQSRRLQADGRAAVTSMVEAENPWWGVFTRSLAAQGLAVEPDIFPAATDASYLRVKGIPSLGFSPMRRTPRLLHEHDEFLGTEVYEEGIAIYQRLIADLASQPSFPGELPVAHDEL